jgi:hypothetical protein
MYIQKQVQVSFLGDNIFFVGDVYVDLTYDLEELLYTEACWGQKQNIDTAVRFFHFLVVDIARKIWWR